MARLRAEVLAASANRHHPQQQQPEQSRIVEKKEAKETGTLGKKKSTASPVKMAGGSSKTSKNSKQLKGKAAAAALAGVKRGDGLAYSSASPNSDGRQRSFNERAWAEARGLDAVLPNPASVDEAFFLWGSEVEGGVRAALDGEAMALQALVPPRCVRACCTFDAVLAE